MKTLIIDNYDSFTYNLYQLFSEVNGECPTVIKNDECTWEELQRIEFDNVVISPGPGHPEKEEDFGICSKVIKYVEKPILGICLGHQGIFHVFGGKVINAPIPMHGRVSEVKHNGKEIFKDIVSPFKCVRYHSLMCNSDELPEVLQVVAETEDGIPMGIAHKNKPIWGVQFHPESICSEAGRQIAKNFLNLTYDFYERGYKRYSHTMRYEKLKVDKKAKELFSNIYGNSEYAVWLDSSRVVSGMSRFSYMGAYDGDNDFIVKYNTGSNEVRVISKDSLSLVNSDIFTYVNDFLRNNRVKSDELLPFDFMGGFIGYFGYELKKELLNIPTYESKHDDSTLIYLNKFIVYDHEEDTVYLVYLKKQSEDSTAAENWINEIKVKIESITEYVEQKKASTAKREFFLERDKEQYIKDIEKCQEYLRMGESYEICLTNKLYAPGYIEPLNYYLKLRDRNPAPYSAYLKLGNECSVTCSSMERFLKLNREGLVETKPIKGTLPRGKDAEEDLRLTELLETDEKYRSENLMIVDLLRNDFGRVCEIGSVHVSALMKDEVYETVHQLVSTVEGKLLPGYTIMDCLKATFPGGSMTGAPKKRTLELIDTMEKSERGIYSGTIGFISINRTADLNIVIRTAIIDEEGMSIGVGGAITIMSDPEEEYNEILLKGRALVEVAEEI